ncbi:MAG TPA: RodZ domain-containing protein [Actinomycetota bacterium]|nr:RodZ domain-containing protein [Actinomycetota bacterium]
MARPDCPRCGSDLVVAAPSGAPSEHVLELRGGKVPVLETGGGPVHWLCRSCAYEWDPSAYPERWVPGPGDPLPDGEALLADLDVTLEPLDGAGDDADGTLPSPGAALRDAREQAGKTLAEGSKATGIWERHLQALESDAPVEAFPAAPYARFFLREYAEFLKLDPGPLLREFDVRHPTVEEPPLEPLPDRRGRRRGAAVFLTLVSIAALAVIAMSQRPPPDDARPTVPAQVASVAVHDSGRVPLPSRATSEPNGVRAVLVLTQPSWVEAVADGQVVASQTLQPGERVVYRARRLLHLRLGNAGGVHLRINGEPVETGSPGQVVTFDVRWKDGRVLGLDGG